MSDSKLKKGLSLLLAIIMVFTMMPVTIFSLGADESNLPVMKAFTSVAGDFHAYKTEIVTVTFLDYIDETEYAACNPYAWDISASSATGTVKAWMKVNSAETAIAGATRYDVYIGGNGGVAANENSTDLFWNFNKMKEVNGLENFDTSNAVVYSYMFNQCSSLEYLDLSSFDTSSAQKFIWMFTDCQALKTLNLSGWDTSNVTTMDSMFKNCYALEVLDVSSFDTRKVTNMSNMFYQCKALRDIYIGDNWTVEKASGNAMFNCCYAIVGGIDVYDRDYKYITPGKEYAKLRENGGFLTYKAPDAAEEYTVTYSFTGDTIPENVTLPADAVYEDGTTVFVESAPSADGYIFSGWTTDDTTVTDNSFVINNNVHFVGSWEKLYNVYYKYDDNFEVPEGAPAPEMLEMLGSAQRAGDDIDVAGVLYADGRHIFVGWYTDDADIAGNMFTMPEKDVTLYCYFKIPVESIEILDNENLVLNGGEKSKLNVYVKPEDATIKDIIYESSNPDIAAVDKYGNITAVEGAEGTATITVKSKDDPTKSDTIEVTVKKPVTELKVTPIEITIREDGSEKIKATVNEDATNKEVTYTSKDETIVTVDENGIITPVGPGTTTITVASKDDPSIKKTVTVTVKNPVTEITAEDIELTVGEVKNLEAKVNEDATNKELLYDTSDPGVVKVDSNGDVIAVGEGETTITITSKDNPEIKTTVTVKVNAKFYKVTYEYIGEVHPKNEPTVPDEETYKESSEVTVADVPSADGYIFSGWTTEDEIAIKDNKFNIYNNVHFVGEWSKIPVEDIIVNKNSIELTEGETDKITVTVNPDNATDKEVEFKSDNEAVAKVDKHGNVTAVGEGTATITITSKDGSATETVTVIVEKPVIPVEDIIVDKSEIELEPGDTDKITVTVNPDNATDKEVEFKSDNEAVAKVDKDGNVTAVGEGTATITITSKDGSVTETVTIIVKKSPVKITVPEKITVVLGEEKEIEATINADATLTYKSDDETVAKVDANGKITAVGAGKTTITVSGGGLSAVIAVEVKAKPDYTTKHYMVFGKTEKIGWYSVSLDGGETFLSVFGNSHLEVEHGSEVIIKANDVFGDPFTFYINGKAVKPDEKGYIRVIVDKYVLVGALGIPIEAPDVEESLNLFQRLIQAIKNFFAMIAGWLKK